MSKTLHLSVEDILEEVPINELVNYVLETNALTNIINGDRNKTFELLDNLDYAQIKEWLVEAAKYRLNP